jgi:phage repressor protein C with HTH and peptisase S24 domain
MDDGTYGLTIEEKLKNKILKEFKSIRAFTLHINEPYSTINMMLKRKNGVYGASITTIIKICNALNISADGLANGEIVEKEINIKSYNLSQNENELLSKIKSLTSQQQTKLIEMIDLMFDYDEDEMTDYLEENNFELVKRNKFVRKNPDVNNPTQPEIISYVEMKENSNYVLIRKDIPLYPNVVDFGSGIFAHQPLKYINGPAEADFAIKLMDEGMLPYYEEGAYVFAVNRKKIKSGEDVIFETTIRNKKVYNCRRLNRTKDGHIELIPENEEYPILRYQRKEVNIIARVLDFDYNEI